MSAHLSVDPAVFDGHTILLVEDNEDDALIMQRAFQRAGIANPLQCVSDGQKAMAYLEEQGHYSDRRQYLLPIIILLDLSMPRMNGLELLHWIRQQPLLKRTTVHVLTASNRGEDVNQAFDAGANAYMVKPGKFDSLVEMVKAWHTLARFAVYPPLGGDPGGGGMGFPSVRLSGILPRP
jgi:CheY-like chemotaxis protein